MRGKGAFILWCGSHAPDPTGARQNIDVAADGDFRYAKLAGEIINPGEFVVTNEAQQLLPSRVGTGRLARRVLARIQRSSAQVISHDGIRHDASPLPAGDT